MRSSFRKAAYVHKPDPAHVDAFQIGCRVRHAQRGEGIIEGREYSQRLGETILAYRVGGKVEFNFAADLELIPEGKLDVKPVLMPAQGATQ